MRKPLLDIVKVGRRGEIMLPRRVRNTLGLREGDELVVMVEDRRMVMERRARQFGTYLDVLGGGGDDSPQDD